MEESKKALNRRNFMTAAGALSAAGLVMAACGGEKEQGKESVKRKPVDLKLPPLLDQAPDGPLLKAGLVGCGGRGTGAAVNFLNAGPNLEITALADLFQDRLDGCRKKLEKEFQNVVEEKNCFLGFDAFQKLIDSGVDVVILATPPHFRPAQFAAAVDARKHVFMEKPVCVDPVGARSIMATSKQAEAAGLSVVTGTQRRHQRDYVETYKQIMNGAIGDIVSANCYWNQSQLWYRNREEGWSDMEWMIRDWVNWCWLSGDHIVEQHVHNIDVIHWFTGKRPVKAVGFGGRHRRVTGDQYDFFSVDYLFEDPMHMQSMSRQINGCVNNVSESVIGTQGSSNCRNTLYHPDGSVAWTYDYGQDAEGKDRTSVAISPYDQEHIDLITAIRTNQPIVEAETTAISTLIAIMGRISAYTGKEVTYEEMMQSDIRLGPKDYALGPMPIEAIVPQPGA